MQMGAVVEVQRTPDPIHAPPVPHAVGVVALARHRLEPVGAAVDGDRPADAARDFVAGGDPVGVRGST